jgi:hypothetical protein
MSSRKVSSLFIESQVEGKNRQSGFEDWHAHHQMYVIYVRENFGPKYLKRLFGEIAGYRTNPRPGYPTPISPSNADSANLRRSSALLLFAPASC